MVERNRGEQLIRRFVGRGNEPDPCDVKIASLKQRIQELEFLQLQQDSPTEEAETESNDMRDEEEEYPFVNKYLNFQEEPIMLVEEELCPVYDTDNEKEESMPVYDTDIEEVIEEEDGDEIEVVYDDYEESSVFDDDQYEEEIVSEDFGKGFGEEEDTSEDTELREHHTNDKDCDETHTRQIFDHYAAELFHQDLHGQMLYRREKVKERLRNSDPWTISWVLRRLRFEVESL
nr:paired amphipathic helix protein Sin3-like 3 isoform X1 [Tanacetum cinerariifolium]